MALLRLRLNHRALTKSPPLTHLFSSSSSDPSEPKLDSSDLRHQPTTTPHMDAKVSSGKGGGESERVVKKEESEAQDLRWRINYEELRQNYEELRQNYEELKHKMKIEAQQRNINDVEKEGLPRLSDRETERKSVVKMEESEAQHLGGTRRISIEDLRQSLCGLKIEEKKDTKQKMKMGQTRDNMMKPAKKEGLVDKNFHPKNMSSAKKLKGKARDESEAQQRNINDVEKEGLPRLSDRETERKSVVKMEESEAQHLGGTRRISGGLNYAELRQSLLNLRDKDLDTNKETNKDASPLYASYEAWRISDELKWKERYKLWLGKEDGDSSDDQ